MDTFLDEFARALGVDSYPQRPPLDQITMRTGYCDNAFRDLEEVVGTAMDVLEDIPFDTIVGRGVSGAMVVPTVAMMMNKKFLIARKPNDCSHHDGPAVGQLGKQWIFLDDFACTGNTRRQTRKAVAKCCSRWSGFETEFMGSYYYATFDCDRDEYGCFIPSDPNDDPDIDPETGELWS